MVGSSNSAVTNFFDDSALYGVEYNYWVIAKDSVGNTQEVAQAQGSQSEKLWEYTGTGGVYGAPAIGPDGTIYIATSGSTAFNSSLAPGRIVALTTDGAVKWESAGTRGFMNTPAVSVSGNVYAINADGQAYAFTADGELKWRRQVSGGRSPTITGDNLIILPTTNGISALDEEGTLVWAYNVPLSSTLSSAVGRDGTIYLSRGTQQLFALSRMGKLKWVNPLQSSGAMLAAPVILPDDSVLFARPSFNQNVLFSLSSAGLTNGQITIPVIRGTPVVSSNGIIFVPSRSTAGPTNQIFMTSFGGSSVSNTVENFSYEPFTLSSDNTLYISGARSGIAVGPALYSQAPDGKWQTNLYGRGILGPATFHPSGLLLVGTSAGRLYAMPSTQNLPTNGWPTARADLRQSGNLSEPSPAPNTPEWLIATVEEYVGEVRLSWADAEVFRYVEVWRSATTNFQDAVLVRSNVVGSSYFDTEAPQGTNFYFVRARNSAGTSGVSEPTSGSPSSSATLKWIAAAGGLAGMPSVDQNGRVYASANNGSIRSYASNGVVRWTLPNAIYNNETPVVIDLQNQLHTWEGSALVRSSTNGTILDRWLIGPLGGGDISVALDGTVYLNRSELSAYSPLGALKWKWQSQANVAAALDRDGNLYVAARNTFDPIFTLEAYSPAGKHRWSFTNSSPVSSVAIRSQGILIGSESLTALNFDGEIQWSTNLAVLREPIVGGDGTIFIASSQTNFYALSASGQVKWSYPTQSWGALVSEEGNVYINVMGGVLALSPEGQKLWSFLQPNVTSPSIGLALSEAGNLHFSLGTNVLVLNTKDHPSEHTWSTVRGNMRRTGQLLQPMWIEVLSLDFDPDDTNRVWVKASIRVPVKIEASEDLVSWTEVGRSNEADQEFAVRFGPGVSHSFIRMRVTEAMEPVFEPLIDTFNDLTQDAEKWFKGTLSTYLGASLTDLSVPVEEVVVGDDGKLVVSCLPHSIGFRYNGYVSRKYYDFSRKQLTVEVVQIPNPTSTAEMLFSIGADGANLYRFHIQSGDLRADMIVQGMQNVVQLGTFSSVNHRHLRIRHDDAQDQIIWESSPNRTEWTVLHTRSRDFPIRNVRVEFFGGTYEGHASPGSAVFDDVELIATPIPVE